MCIQHSTSKQLKNVFSYELFLIFFCVCERRVFTKKLQLNETLKLSVRTLRYRSFYTSGHSYEIYETSLGRVS